MEEKWFPNPILAPVTKTSAAGQHCGCKFILKCSLITFHLSPSKFISRASWSMRGQKKNVRRNCCVCCGLDWTRWCFRRNLVLLVRRPGRPLDEDFPLTLSLSLSVNIRRQDRMCCWGGQTELIFNFILHVYHHGRMSPFFVGLTDQPETSTMCFEHGCPRINLGNESNFWLFIGTIRRNVQQIRCLVVWSFTRNFEMVFNAESTKWVILVLVHEFLKLLQLTWNTYILITENATVLKAIQAILILLQFEFSRKANPLPNQQTNPYSW